MDYDFTRLSTRTFEQLTQALAAKALGPGVMVFGDGPDGGREASHIGKVPYPNEAEQWEGTIVLQAKFRQRPTTSRSDAAWAANQLKEELKATFRQGSPRVSPTHYIFATNVGLSSLPKKGGKAHLEDIASKFPLEGFHLWDRDKIEALLDDSQSIRNGFLGYICPGDVLTEIRKHVRSEAPDFDKVIANFLEKELLADQYANLEQGGRIADEKIPISQVFIDLPTQSEETDGEPEGLAGQLLAIAGERLSPSSHDVADLQRGASSSGPVKGRLVLVGGPGQGKTTLGQYVCQLFRTSLLQSRPVSRLSPEARTAMALILSQSEEDGIDLPPVRRFPIRIPLTELSDSLASDESPSTLLEFMTERINRRVSRSLPAETLRAWLGEYPWLLVLDGLDEVPASSNRAAILDLIRDFWVDAANEDADVLVLATTRPQGYNNDFSPNAYRHITLAPLSDRHALKYGRRLAQARHSSDDEKRAKVIDRLEQAVRSPSTSKLMTSPLQVTIMSTLVGRGGSPPRERWNLFSEYYSVIYTREVEREITAAQVLEDHKPDIDAIHHRVALILQAEGELAGQGDARMSADRFATIVRQRLAEEGHEGEALTELTDRIIKAAGDRLVFLVGLKEDEVGFEIRSLQEFMAAEALMNGGEEHVTARLRAIAGVTSWRNVFLFAGGKCYAERQHLRDTIYTICVELNEQDQDPLAAVVKPGSVLATDLLLDGFSLNQPAHSRLLGKEALELLSDPATNPRLLRAYHSSLEKAYKPAIAKALASKSPASRRKGLALSLALSADKVKWAEAELDATVPEDGDGLKEVLETVHAFDFTLPAWAFRRAKAHAKELSMRDAVELSDELALAGHVDLEALDILSKEGFNESESFMARGLEGNRLSFTLNSLRPRREDWGPDLSVLPDLWPTMVPGIRFAESPSAIALAAQLRDVAMTVPPAEWEVLASLSPWPMAATLLHADGSAERLHELATSAEEGELGDGPDWLAAEERWTRGVGCDDLAHLPQGDLPFDRHIDARGFPTEASGWSVSTLAVRPSIKALVDWLRRMPNRASAKTILEWTVGLARIPGVEGGQLPKATVYGAALFEHRVTLNPVETHFLLQALHWAKNPSEDEKRLLETIGEDIGPLVPDNPWRLTLPIEELPTNLLHCWNAGHKTTSLYRVIALSRPAAGRGRRSTMASAPGSIVNESPGATGLLQLKEKQWSGKSLDQAIGLIAEVSGEQPIWLQAAVGLCGRAEEPDAEKALGALWKVATSGVLDDADLELIAPYVRKIAKDVTDRRATELLDPKVWKELEFFEVPAATD